MHELHVGMWIAEGVKCVGIVGVYNNHLGLDN